MDYFAHSGRNLAGKLDFQYFQPLSEHLRRVADGAKNRATAIELPSIAELAFTAGLLHDLGKYRPEFQQYIQIPNAREKGDPQTYHKQAGAALAYREKNVAIALVIVGHHGGLPDRSNLHQLSDRISCPSGLPVLEAVWSTATKDCPDLLARFPAVPQLPDGFAWDLFTRVLFSCLVDADWADTGKHERESKDLPEEPSPPNLEPGERLKRVEGYIAERAGRQLEPHVKKARADVLAACLKKAEEPPNLFSLTVPTGGGKTLAGLAFALKHAAKHGLRRVIYVAPYMTILEQNADVIREALGIGDTDPAVFEHYSLAEPPGDAALEELGLASAARRAENWDAPVVVTTNVQFFESLFSNKPGRCRKLHNIAGSVIILDECQTLPPGLAAPTCGMLKQLQTALGCSVVLCTATQPAFDHEKLREDERLTTKEIIPETANLFEILKRVQVTWPKPTDAPLSWVEVAVKMRGERSALCVVNTKRAARAVYDELVNGGASCVFHLSTGMCPQHRREKLTQIRGLLSVGAPCFVVSTQLIEAGVDVDFPFVMREMGPLESVIQASGRCNREGRLPNAGGRVLVFRSLAAQEEPKKYYPPDRWYKAGRDKLEQIIAANGDGPQIDDPVAIRDYFSRLYHTGSLDADGVQEMRKTFKFKSVAETYQLIKDAGQPVIVATWDSHRGEIASLLGELAVRPRKVIYRKLAPFQVNLLPSQRLNVEHLIHEATGGVLVWDGKYDEAAGIIHEMLDEVLVV